MNLLLLVLLLLIVLGGGAALLRVADWRPERLALALAVAVVVIGAAVTTLHVIDGIHHSRVQYHGKLDSDEILNSFAPARSRRRTDPTARFERARQAYLSSADGEMTVPHPSSKVLVLWAIEELAPWLLAAIVLVLLIPILRAAERGDPFWEGAARRLTVIGTLLLIGIPAIAIFRFVVAEVSTEGTSVEPFAEPSLQLSIGQILPGILVLVLAGIFRRGVELRDLERHTI